MKERALQVSETTEINDIKEDLLRKLCSLDIAGFKTKEEMIAEKIEQLGTDYNPSKRYELEERGYLSLKNSQMTLIGKFLNSDDFTKNSANKADEQSYEQTSARKKPVYQANLARREKKVTIIKLSKHIRNELANFDKDDGHFDDQQMLASLKNEDFQKISTAELEKINKSKSDKSYYNESEIEETFQDTKRFLVELREKGQFNVEKLELENVGKLVDAVSFSLNGIHYYQKFKKSKAMVHPIDILYILSKFK